MRISYAGTLNPLKSLSDQIIYHPVKYKILFGINAEEELQATFKVVKNLRTNVTNAVVRTRVIQAINEFFALNNWDFGDTFYFTELAAYIHAQLAPVLGRCFNLTQRQTRFLSVGPPLMMFQL
jgi:hypothetical protein